MSAAATINPHATPDSGFDEPYLWRGGRFLALYVIIMIDIMVRLGMWLL